MNGGLKMKRTRLLPAVIVVGLVTACSGGDNWQGTITDSAGVAIVANTDQGVWSASSRWSLEEELKIGAICFLLIMPYDWPDFSALVQ